MVILCRRLETQACAGAGGIATTNSRDTIYQAKISPTCDKLAPRRWEALLVTASTAVYSTITGGRLTRVKEVGVL